MKQILLFCFPLFFLCSCSNKPSGLIDLIKEHKTKYEFMNTQDVYKLLYQSVFGVKHLLSDTNMSRNYLFNEFKSIESINEELIENISPDGSIIRINLKAFKFLNLKPEILFEVMKISANEIDGNKIQFENAWKEFEYATKAGKLKYNLIEITDFPYKIDDNIKEMHHSREFMEKYKPSYRVVKKEVFFNYFRDQKKQ